MKKLIMIAACLVFLSCEDTPVIVSDPSVLVTKESDCKSSVQVLDSNRTVVNWSYDGKNLYIKRTNAGFNCGAEKLTVNMAKSGDTLELTENWIGMLADCSCLFDFEYTIKDIEAGNYKIILHEPLIDDYRAKYKIEFNINLYLDKSGEISQIRTFYPWGI